MQSRRAGLGLVYERNPHWWGNTPYLDRVIVRFVERLEVLLSLLDSGRLDAAAPLSTVNLEERLDGRGLRSAARLGWESIYLDFEGSRLSRRDRKRLAASIDLLGVEEGLIRDDGRISTTLRPSPGEDGATGPWAGARVFGNAPDEREFEARNAFGSRRVIKLAAPIGDELLELIQGIVQAELAPTGVEVQLVTVDASTFYGRWRRAYPADAAVRRSSGGPGVADERRPPRRLDAFPLFHVESVVAWRPGVHGPAPNPTFEGPLWNLEQWWEEKEGVR